MLIKWLKDAPDWRTWNPKAITTTDLMIYEEFAISHHLVLTNCYILNSWWLSMLKTHGPNIFQWMQTLDAQSIILTAMLLKTAYVWFGKAPRKPPDKREYTHHKNDIYSLLMDHMAYLFYFIEDTLYYCFKINIDLCYWTCILGWILSEYLIDLLKIFIAIEFNEEEIKDTSWNQQMMSNIPLIEINKKDPYRFKRGKIVTSNLVFSMSTKSKKNELDSTIQLDSDSYSIAIDTCTSETIVKHKELFVGNITPAKNLYVQGVGGQLKAYGYGTIKIRVTCDDGKQHDLLVHNVIYLPESPVNLLSPQKWSLGSTNVNGTGEITVGDTTLLFWNNRQTTKLIPHHPELGIPIMSINDGYTQSSAFLQLAATSMLCQPCTETITSFRTSRTIEDPVSKLQHVIPIDDEDQEFIPLTQNHHDRVVVDELDKIENRRKRNIINDDLDQILTSRLEDLDDAESVSQMTDNDNSTMDNDEFPIADTEPDDEEFETAPIPLNEIDKIVTSISEKTSNLQRELLSYHFKLKHLPFASLKKLATRGIIPKRLANVPSPLCYPCQMGKQHKKPWRGKGKKYKTIRRAQDNFAGANTSTDQMISPYGGMIPQVKGRLMKAKYYAATIFVDHHTDFTYVHLQKDTTAEATLEAKNAYEHLLQTFGHKVLAYHADNGRFAEKMFVGDVRDKAQNITYCGVGSHHQNGIAERKIRTLGEDARTMLAHGQHLWPEAVTKTLWPFAYKASCRSRNRYKLDDKLLCPEEKLTGLKVNQEIRNEHPLFCPVFVLDSKLQGTIGGLPKWNPRARAGIYLGHSPDHASNVALVLNLATGLVSPQYHVIFDDDFSTVDFIKNKKEPTNWENLCRYHTEDYRMEALPGVQTLDDLQLDTLPTKIHDDTAPAMPTTTPPPSEASASSQQPSTVPTPADPVINSQQSTFWHNDDQSGIN